MIFSTINLMRWINNVNYEHDGNLKIGLIR